MKSQTLFSVTNKGRNKTNIINWSSVEFAQRVVDIQIRLTSFCRLGTKICSKE